MVSNFTLPHIDISSQKQLQGYVGKGAGGGNSDAPIRGEHGRRLQRELAAAYDLADAGRPDDERLPTPDGVYLEIDLRHGAKVEDLEKKKSDIKPAAVRTTDNQDKTIALFVPDRSRAVLDEILNDYTSGPLTGTGKPPKKDFPEAIAALRNARLETFWTDDPQALPANPQDAIWWEVWCWPDDEGTIDQVTSQLQIRAAACDQRLYFHESTVIPVYATRAAIELMLFATCSIIELRRASDNPLFFTENVYESQEDWVEELAERITWPNSSVPTVCLLDTGVNRAHSLIEPTLSSTDCFSVKSEWGADDHFDGNGHGTVMAGMALYGDLVPILAGQSNLELKHRLESVKILPPRGFDPTDSKSYGAITQAAIALPEIEREDRLRTFCLSVTNENVSGSIPSTWSAAIDQAASGEMIGDEDDAPQRLIIISAGNVPAEIERGRILDAEFYPIEDPAQAWNAITVGGYTDKDNITETGLNGWTPFSEVGGLSPFSRTSISWPHSKSPIKPEIVMEAGNRAVSPSGREVISTDSLALLGTGKDHGTDPIVSFSATSAAAAQGARLAARISASNATWWPEMVRALMIHSAEWTQPMLDEFSSTSGVRDNYAIIRKYGYGLPSYQRAIASAQNHLALMTQSSIQPYKVDNGRKFNECHYYPLPWPRDILEQLNNTEIRLKITLSYFVEPNPGLSASIDPQRYQSYGLRFDLRRKNETLREFKKGVNLFERETGERARRVSDDGNWVLGPQAISAGSLHCDVWTGPAIDLLSRDTLCVYPVGGWWRNRAKKEICEKMGRYALVVTIQTPDVGIDLHTHISQEVEVAEDISILM